MNQSNKQYLEFLVHSGVEYFLQNKENNYYTQNKKADLRDTIVQNNDLNKINNVENLKKELDSLNHPLKKNTNKTVIFDGNLSADLMIIGEAPGREEDLKGLPFMGMAGQLLNKMLSAINLKREEVYITNVVPWRPPNNRTPTNEEILEFLPYLQKQIEIIKPKLIFLLGGTAAKAILSTSESLGKLRGKWYEYKSINLNSSTYVLVSYHPAFLLRSPNYKKEAWVDLQMLQKKLNEI
ncbi:MAG: uracil-DNA glycosylase [Pelagibacteraceae bacterium]|nr:uracil-DNA glycosylase [Pelagibacteraceae bacterium]|tara:strand:- start:44303 stop:45016 length:714 start_codon:yes stop_codon:yes gene_type:complete